MSDKKQTIGILGGTGKLGSGLAVRFGSAGHDIVLGSRDGERAAAIAAELSQSGSFQCTGGANELAAACDIVIVSVPFSTKAALLAELGDLLAEKLVIDATVPLVPPKVSRVQLPEGGSGSLQTRALLPEGAKLVAAFQNVSAQHLADIEHDVPCDVLVCGDDADSRALACSLIKDAGLAAIEAGPLENAAAADALTSVLIWINRHYGAKGAGIRVTGI